MAKFRVRELQRNSGDLDDRRAGRWAGLTVNMCYYGMTMHDESVHAI
jgi:hypothetical protein